MNFYPFKNGIYIWLAGCALIIGAVFFLKKTKQQKGDKMKKLIEINEITCDACGEVLATYEDEYKKENPDGYHFWVEQLYREHEDECPQSAEDVIQKVQLPSVDITFCSASHRGIKYCKWEFELKSSQLDNICEEWNNYIRKLPTYCIEGARGNKVIKRLHPLIMRGDIRDVLLDILREALGRKNVPTSRIKVEDDYTVSC